jgi:DNA-binding MarR family transcriptional regulator
MEQRGLIERRRDADDRRVIRVELATGGRELLAGMTADRRQKLTTLLDDLTDDELDGFLRGMRALRSARDRFIERTAANAPTPTDDEAQR